MPARRWRDYETAAGRRPVKQFIGSLGDEDAAEVVAAWSSSPWRASPGRRRGRHRTSLRWPSTALLTGEIVHERSDANPEFPRLVDAATRRRAVMRQLAARRASLGLSQTAVAARMHTSQPVVARLESGDLDSRLSTLERFAAAVGLELDLVVREPAVADTADDITRG